MSIRKNLKTLQDEIIVIEKQFAKKANSVRLLAVSKSQNIEKIKQAIAAGQRCFGENYIQEAITKINNLSDYDLEWHFIGPIQANKTRLIATHFSWVQSVDRTKIAQRLNDQRPQRLPPLNICIQINISAESTKSGVPLAELPLLARFIDDLPQLKLRGLMAIPEPSTSEQQQRASFKELRLAYENLKNLGFDLDTLSMGMSQDYRAAIAEGSTMVRLGTMIFGERELNKT